MPLLHLRSSLQCVIYKRCVTTSTRLYNSSNNGNNYNTFTSKSSNTESNQTRQAPSSSNRFQDQYAHRNHHHRHSHRLARHQRQPHHRKTNNSPPSFNLQTILDTGSESAQNALKSILARIQRLQPLDKPVQYVSPTQGLITCPIQQVLEGLDLSSQGLQLIEREATNNGSSTASVIPLIKRIKIQEMLKSYNDELAEAKELELLNMGSKKTIKALDNKLRAKQKKSSEKQIMIKWSISLNDLTNQKQVEIDNRLRKESGKIVIYLIHNKKAPMNLKITDIFKNSRSGDDADVAESMDIELRKRGKVKETLENILNSLECKWTSEGDVESRMVYSITSTASDVSTSATATAKASEENSQKSTDSHQQKKKQKAKTVTNKSESKVDEEDLDALYSFKIED
ncbi:AIM23 [Candida metapsilosis]|uniref:Altered inheritance of mitochondria protein 23, mitochondrial n=1 Tax=Candida metapsilosis TaxID=273372 RepID=A0A8H7ZFL1_9ASCO|nr:AIM23 [Candida metapsilosis]